MLEHLLEADPKNFVPTTGASPADELAARFETAKLLDEEVTLKAQEGVARNAFMALTANRSLEEQKEALAALDVPDAVKELVGMLTAYDWMFVQQAQELRGYTVAKLVEESQHPDARIRLKALELIGKVTEVALFTERSEVKHTSLSDTELDEELKKRLAKYIELQQPEKEIVDVIEPSNPDRPDKS